MAPTKAELENLYWDQELSGREIARKLSVPAPTVFSWLKHNGIKLRDQKTAIRIYLNNHPEHIRIFSAAGVKSLHGRKQSQDTITKRVNARKGYRHSNETKQKIAVSNTGKHWTKEQREWLLPIVMKNRLQRPTSIERLFLKIVDKYNLPYKYVGDGYTFIAGRCPDYLNVNGAKEVVEIFSRWWHDPSVNPKVKLQHTEKATLDHYFKYGFKCIIIWEEELKDEELVLQKVMRRCVERKTCQTVSQ
jgi:hypothetical protein